MWTPKCNKSLTTAWHSVSLTYKASSIQFSSSLQLSRADWKQHLAVWTS